MGFSYRYLRTISPDNAIFALRGNAFWKDGKFNPNRVSIVTTLGSKKTRMPLKIYKEKSNDKE
jgi:putative heme iron utilization protein